MKFKVVAIYGSPRRGGNSEILLNNFLEELDNAEVRRFFLNEMRFLPCQECENIRKDGKCKIEDDMQKLYPEIENADLVVVASPVFFGSVSAQIKMMIDRFQCQWLAINIFKTFTPKKKKGLFLCVEASERKDFFENAKVIIKNFFKTIGAEYSGEVLCCGVGEKGEIEKKKECIERVKELAEKIKKE